MVVALGLLACGTCGVAVGAGQETRVRVAQGQAHARSNAAIPARVWAARRFLARRGFGPDTASTTGRRAVPLVSKKTRSVNAVPLAITSLATGPVWTTAGPLGLNSLSYGLVTGRISAAALDPSDATGNTVFLGTTGGGVWKSQNAAASTASSVVFTPVTDGLAALSGAPQAGISVGAVTVQPGGTGVVLAGLGDPNDALDSYYGAGLLRSTDGGKTWALIAQTMDLEDGLSTQDYSFVGEGFAGFAWSSNNVQLVVAAVSQAYEGTLAGAGIAGSSCEGLYYSTDGGATWHLARITDASGADVQGPGDPFPGPDGNAATTVVWNPVRQIFVAAVRFHGYYQSADGENWTRLAISPNGQPGTGLTPGNCPTETGSVGVAGCPIFRGSLAVNPQTGDTFAWTVDEFNQDQGIWQDVCAISGVGAGASCTNPTLSFATQLNTAALETSSEGGDATILNGDYNLALAAIPSEQDTLIFAGGNDLWRCSLANSCVWRNTTNSTTCISAQVGEYQHAVAWDAGDPAIVYVGNDSGLWRSEDAVAETGAVCAATDSSHFQNLNGALEGSGSLAEVESLGQSVATASAMVAGLGGNGVAGVAASPATAWNEVLGGEGGPVAEDPTSRANSWYANNAAGVSIFHCTAVAGTACTAAGFGTTPVIGELQVEDDGLGMSYPAEFAFDALDPTQLLVGTCRLWRGPESGVGWTVANAISPVLDGSAFGLDCAGNGLIRSIAAGPVAAGGEVIYVGMAGSADGGGVVAGHLFSATLTATGVVSGWTDLALSPVTNTGGVFNSLSDDVSAIYVDPHDTTAQTVYAAIQGFGNAMALVQQQVYRSTDGGRHWNSIQANLPNAPANAIVVDPQDSNTVYVGMDTGVYVTRAIATCATSTCWSAYGTGLPLAPVTQLAATPSGAVSQTLTAGTYGRGVWQIPLETATTAQTTAVVTPTSLTFSAFTVGTASNGQTVTIKDMGASTLEVTGIAFANIGGGTAASDFSETDTCTGVVVAKNATCTVRVTFTPTQTGSRAAEMIVNANLAGGQTLVTLTGTGLAPPAVTLQPGSVTFTAPQQVGTTSAGQSVSLANSGGTAVTVTSIAVTAPFTKSANTCSSSLAANTACAITVAFAPTAAGAATGTLTVTDSIGTQTVSLSGTAVTGPTDTLSTTTLSFPSIVETQISAPLTVTISNTGGLPLTGIGNSIVSTPSGDFAAVNSCGSTLAAGSSCSISVTFTPSVLGSVTGTLTISDAIHAQTVALKGAGLKPPLLSLSRNIFPFGSVELGVASSPISLTISNTGGAPMAAPSFSFSGPGAAAFSAVPSGSTPCGTTAGSTLAASASCTESLIFTPIAAGATTATLTVATSTLGVASVPATMSGTGLTPPMLGVSPTALQMGTVVLGDSTGFFTVQITNTGQIAMNQPTFSVTGLYTADFVLSAPTDSGVPACTGALNPNASCNIQVTFSPSVLGTETATLAVASTNAQPPTATVALSGLGSPPILLQASVPQLSFAATPVGTTTVTQTVTISNLGRQTANGLLLAVSGPYAIVTGAPTTCKGSLTQKTSCVVGLTFTPTASGDQPGLLTATVTNLGVPPLTVSLDGTGVAVGGITLLPTQMTFGSVVVKMASAAQTLEITNSGQAALAGVKLQVTGNYTLTANTCSATLQAGASCSTGIVFTPPSIGQWVGTGTISTTSAGVPAAVFSLIGYGIPAGALSAAPAVVSFGSITVGNGSPAQTVVLTNAGSTVLAGLQFALAGDYSLPSNGCGTQLAAGATCSFTVSFSPSQAGTRIGSVTVQSTNTGFTPVVVGLTGNGLASAKLVVAPLQLSFGSVTVGSDSAAQQFTITNPGTGTLQGVAFAFAAPFSVGTGTCGPLLAAGGSCTAPVIFTPAVSGSQNGVVTATTTSLGVPPVAIAVSGSGVHPPSLSLAPASLTFNGTVVGSTSAGQTITVTNPGGAGLAGLKLASSGDFGINSNGCTSTLAAGASCSAVVTFTPQVAGGRPGFLTATSTTAGVNSVSAPLSGTGVSPPVLQITPAQLTFTPTLVGTVSATQTATVTNTGQAATTDLQYGVTTGFGVDASKTTCTAALTGGASCKVGVLFAPQSGGVLLGAITASSTAFHVSATAVLNATGALPPGLSATPAALVQFGTIGVGQAAQSIVVTVTNTGTLLPLTGLALGIDATGTAAGYGLSANTCGSAASPVTLAPVASCTVQVTLTPAVAGALTGMLSIASANGGTEKLALAGIGFDFHFAIVGNATATVIPGQTAYYTMDVTPIGEVAGNFSFTCGQLPANALCIFNPPQFGGLKVTGNVQLGISTGGAVVAAVHNSADRSTGRPKWSGALFLLCGLLALPLRWRRRAWQWQKPPATLCLALLGVALVSGLSSCANSGGGTTGDIHTPGTTPAASYPVTVKAIAAGLSRTVQVTLVVN